MHGFVSSDRVMALLRHSLLMLLLFAAPGASMAQDNAQGAEPPPRPALRQTGTVESLQQDAGYIQISGQRYRVEDGRTRVYVEQQELRLHDLDSGMVVAYATDGSGILLRIDILGPADRIRELERN